MTTLALDRSTAPFETTIETTGPSLFARVREAFTAMNEGLTAYHRYERLRARGLDQAEAARRAFDLDVRV